MPRKTARKTKYVSYTHRMRNVKSAKKIKALRRTIIVAFALLFSVTVLTGYLLYKNVTQHPTSADSANTYSLSEKNIYTILLAPKSGSAVPKLVVVDLNAPKVVEYSLPEMNPDIARLKYSLALQIDRWITVSGDAEKTFLGLLDTGEFGISDIFSLLTSQPTEFTTNSNLSELYSFVSFVKSLPESRIFKKELPKDLAVFDTEIQDMSLDSVVSKEKKSISILNGTNVSGLATYGSRVVLNLGGRAVSSTNASNVYEKSLIITDDVDSYTVKSLALFFNIKKVVSKGSPDADAINESELSRSDITLILGFDTAALVY